MRAQAHAEITSCDAVAHDARPLREEWRRISIKASRPFLACRQTPPRARRGRRRCPEASESACARWRRGRPAGRGLSQAGCTSTHDFVVAPLSSVNPAGTQAKDNLCGPFSPRSGATASQAGRSVPDAIASGPEKQATARMPPSLQRLRRASWRGTSEPSQILHVNR